MPSDVSVRRTAASRSAWRWHVGSGIAPLRDEEAQTTFRVVHPHVNVRDKPSTTGRIVAVRFAGEQFRTNLEQDGWVRSAEPFGSVFGWVLIDGNELGLGCLLERVEPNRGEHRASTPSKSSTMEKAITPLLLQAPRPIATNELLPPGTRAPVRRWRAARPLVLVHGQPSRSSGVVDGLLEGELTWSCEAPLANAEWVRLAKPDGWVHRLCPAGHPQLLDDGARHRGRAERELEALDLYAQARVAVFETYGPRGRLQLPSLFSGWEEEAISFCERAENDLAAWKAMQRARALGEKTPFAHYLLSVVHRDVVLEAQGEAKARALQPAQCRRDMLPGERPLRAAHVAELHSNDLVVVDGVLPAHVIAQCLREAEALDAAGHLVPPAMHRALGDRRDRLVGLNEDTELLPRGSALGQLVAYLKSLAHSLTELGYAEPLTVPASVMLACYDGQGAFYKPHVDSANTDPRRLTAIVYLVPPDWDAAPEADGGQLVWWLVDEDGRPTGAMDEAGVPMKHATDPKAGRLVMFKARTVMHEVLPTHRRRFALTLWYFEGRSS